MKGTLTIVQACLLAPPITSSACVLDMPQCCNAIFKSERVRGTHTPLTSRSTQPASLPSGVIR